MSNEIDNSDDIIDSRNVIERIEELEAVRFSELDEGEKAELQSLRDLASEGEQLADWLHGETLIRDSYFENYARELAEDIGPKVDGWPYDYIDWERAAEALLMDYTSIEFDGVTYWARS